MQTAITNAQVAAGSATLIDLPQLARTFCGCSILSVVAKGDRTTFALSNGTTASIQVVSGNDVTIRSEAVVFTEHPIATVLIVTAAADGNRLRELVSFQDDSGHFVARIVLTGTRTTDRPFPVLRVIEP